MTADWLTAVRAGVAENDSIVSVTVASADGSVPRGPGTWMLVDRQDQKGTIGGGRLEWEATQYARTMLERPAEPWTRSLVEYPLGPDLEQCCGGFVRLLYERLDAPEAAALQDAGADGAIILHPLAGGAPVIMVEDRQAAKTAPFVAAKPATAMLSGQAPREAHLTGTGDDDWLLVPVISQDRPLYLFGAGHVGRALVRALEDLAFTITWVDTHQDRFPVQVPAAVTVVVAEDPARIAAEAPDGAWHLVMTYSHQLDFEICAALLQQNKHEFAGLIGSETKRARFLKRFRDAGLEEASIARLTCPIGLPGIDGKEPATIAIAVAAQLLHRLSASEAVIGRDERRA